MEYELTCDIASNFKHNRLYGRQGDPIKLVADHGNVLIVEGENGERFPVPVEKIKERPPKKKEPKKPPQPVVPELQPKSSPTKSLQPLPVPKTKKSKINTQQNLF